MLTLAIIGTIIVFVVMLFARIIKTALFFGILAAVALYAWHAVTKQDAPEMLKPAVSALAKNPTVKEITAKAATAESEVKNKVRDSLVGTVDSMLGTKAPPPASATPVTPATPEKKVESVIQDQKAAAAARQAAKHVPPSVLQAYVNSLTSDKAIFDAFKEASGAIEHGENLFIPFYENLDQKWKKPVLTPEELTSLKQHIREFLKNISSADCKNCQKT